MSEEMRRLIDLVEGGDLETIDEVFLSVDGEAAEVFSEGMWITGRFPRNIRIDHATSGAGETHAHVFGRKRNQLGVVRLNGQGSHGTKMTLHADDADALRARGFSIPPDNIVEWIFLESYRQILLG